MPKSFQPKDGSSLPTPPARNPSVDVKGKKRGNTTHQSTTDPQAKLYKNGGLRKTRHKGLEKLSGQALLTFAAYNLVRLVNLMRPAAV